MSQSDKPSAEQPSQGDQSQPRIDELEVKVAFMEETIEALNIQLSDLSQEFSLAKQAMQMMNQRLEQIQSGEGQVTDNSDEAPPPHY